MLSENLERIVALEQELLKRERELAAAQRRIAELEQDIQRYQLQLRQRGR